MEQAPTLDLRPSISVTAGDGDNVLLRAGPGITYARVGLLKTGEKAAALGVSEGGDWICIAFSGAPEGRAWIYAAYVKLDFGDLPVLDPVNGKVISLTPTAASQLGSQKGLLSIKKYLKQDNLNVQFLDFSDNLNHFSNPDQRVERYQVGSTIYSTDLNNGYIVEIDTRGFVITAPGSQLSLAVLQQKARSLIAVLAPWVVLQGLTPQPGQKGDNYFFRWVDAKSRNFIQVGYTADGQLLNYVNGLDVP